MKIAVIGGAGVRTVIFINGLLKRYKIGSLTHFLQGHLLASKHPYLFLLSRHFHGTLAGNIFFTLWKA